MDKLRILYHFVLTRYLRKFHSLEALKKYQAKQLKKHFKYLKRHSPYYQQHDLPNNDLMDKAFMMEYFDELNTVGVSKKQAFDIALKAEATRDFSPMIGSISVGLSSGTSGHRGIFLTSAKERSTWAGTILGKLLPKEQLLNHRIAFFMRANNELYETIDSKAIELKFYDMFRPFNELISELLEQQPTILVAPASILLELALELEQSKQVIQPMKVISVAEVLEERDAKYLKKVFKQDLIHQIYQCTEGFLGCTCEYGTMHLNEDIVQIEPQWLDDRRFHPIITDFNRKSQPIVRYVLNDILIQSQEQCPCGSPCMAIVKIEGRADDIFEFVGKDTQTVKVYPDFIRRCLLYVDDIMQYRVIQKPDLSLEIQYIGNLKHQEAIKNEFKNLADQLQFILPDIRFMNYQHQGQAKLKRIIKEVGK